MQKKNIWRIIGLIFLLWLSATGQYMDYINTIGYNKCCLAGLIDTVIISVVMLLIPTIFSIIKKQQLEFNKWKKICKWNSIGMFILSIVISIILFEGNYFIGVGGIGAIIYYYINLWLFVYRENESEEKSDKKILKLEKYKCCKLCGGKFDINDRCEKQYFKTNKNIFLILLIISNLVFIGLYIDSNKKNTRTIDLDASDSWCQTTMDILTKGNSWTYVSEKMDFYDENIVFVIEGYEDYYYTYDCMQKIIDGEEFSYWAYNKEAAKYNGYKEGRCNY